MLFQVLPSTRRRDSPYEVASPAPRCRASPQFRAGAREGGLTFPCWAPPSPTHVGARIDGDLVGIDDVTVVAPTCGVAHHPARRRPGPHVQGVPRAARRVRREQEAGDPALVGRAALRRDARAEDAAGARRAPRRRQVGREPPGLRRRARRARCRRSSRTTAAAVCRRSSTPSTTSPTRARRRSRTAKTRFKELNDSCVDCVVRVSTSEIVDESSALYLNGGDGDGDGAATARVARRKVPRAVARRRRPRRAPRREAAPAARAPATACSRGGHEQRRRHRGGGGGDERRRGAAGAAGGARGGVGRAGQPPPRRV